MSKTMSKFGLEDDVMGSLATRDRVPSSQKDGDLSPEMPGSRRTALADLLSNHLRSKGLRQIDFCRQIGFDQGLLSKILSSVVNTLNVETALKLAEGMNLPASVIFEAIGKSEVHEMLMRVYGC